MKDNYLDLFPNKEKEVFKKIITSSYDYFKQKFEKNIIFTGNSNGGTDDDIKQVIINEVSGEIDIRACLGLYPLEKKGRIYLNFLGKFDEEERILDPFQPYYFTNKEGYYQLDENKYLDYIIKSLDYLCDDDCVGLYVMNTEAINSFLTNKNNIDILHQNGFGVDGVFAGFSNFRDVDFSRYAVMLIRKNAKNILCNDDNDKRVFITQLFAFNDYFTIQKYYDIKYVIGDSCNKERNQIDTKEFNVYEDWSNDVATYFDLDLPEKEEEIIQNKAEDLDLDWGDYIDTMEFEEMNAHVFSICNFTNIEQWLSFMKIKDEEWTDWRDKYYLLSDIVTKKIERKKNKKHIDKKNSVYFSKWISGYHAYFLNKQEEYGQLGYQARQHLCIKDRDNLYYHSSFYDQYEIDTSIVLPEYLEYYFATNSIGKLIASSLKFGLFNCESTGPDGIEGYDLVYSNNWDNNSIYTNLVIKIPNLFEQNRYCKIYKTLKEIKRLSNLYVNALFNNTVSFGTSEKVEKYSKQLKIIKEQFELLSQENTEILDLIKDHETKNIEFKSTWSMNLNHPNKEKDEKLEFDSVLKTICALLNTEGGTLLIGIADNKDILGVDQEIEKFYNKDVDKYKRHILGRLNKFFDVSTVTAKIDLDILESGYISGSKKIVKISCKVNIPTYINNEFYVRQNGRSERLLGEDILKYLEKKDNT